MRREVVMTESVLAALLSNESDMPAVTSFEMAVRGLVEAESTGLGRDGGGDLAGPSAQG